MVAKIGIFPVRQNSEIPFPEKFLLFPYCQKISGTERVTVFPLNKTG